MYCKKCGKELPDGTLKCPDCGTELNEAPATNAANSTPEKKKKGCLKPVLIVAAVIVVIAVVGSIIGGNSDKGDTPASSSSETVSSSASEETVSPSAEIDEEMVSPEAALVGTIDETEIYNANGIVVTISNLDGTDSFSYQIDNTGTVTYNVNLAAVAVNNCMVSDWAYEEVAAEKSAVGTYSISDITKYGFDAVATLDIYLTVSDSDSLQYVDKKACHIDTSIAGQYDTAMTLSGKPVYDGEGLSAQFLGTVDGFFGSDAAFLLYNKTDLYLSASFDETSVNGIMVDTYNSEDILPGCYALSDFTLLNSSLRDKGIESIETFAGKFHAFDQNDLMTTFDSDEITIDFTE